MLKLMGFELTMYFNQMTITEPIGKRKKEKERKKTERKSSTWAFDQTERSPT